METHSNSLFREGHMVVQYILTQFLDFKTLARFKCCCRFTKECIEEYEKTWEGRFKALEGKYRIDLSECEKAIADKKPEDKFRILPENERMLYQTNQMYRHKDFRHVFRMFCGDNQVATMAEKRDGWAHTNNPSYFSVATRHDSIFTEKMPELIDV